MYFVDQGVEEVAVKGELDWGDSVPGVLGIHNHGNTCYMNAVLQCLSNTERLLLYFITEQYKVCNLVMSLLHLQISSEVILIVLKLAIIIICKILLLALYKNIICPYIEI